MKKLFICLANSAKYSERCIAGIEVTKRPNDTFSVVKKNDKQLQWLRPVTSAQYGQVPKELVQNIQLLDICEVETIANCPKGYQSENITFIPNSLKVYSKLTAKEKNLQHFIEPYDTLFGNNQRSIDMENIQNIQHSLQFVKAENPIIYPADSNRILSKLRVKFKFNHQHFDLPITDIKFWQKAVEDKTIIKDFEALYLTISLGLPYQGEHYKLAAGVIRV